MFLNFEGAPASWVPGSQGPESRGPDPMAFLCLEILANICICIIAECQFLDSTKHFLTLIYERCKL